MSTNFVGATEADVTAGFVWTKTDDEDLPQVAQREVDELELLESLVTSTQKKINNMKQRMGGQTKTAWPMAKSQQDAEKKTQQPDAPVCPLEPQYKYVTPIESLETAKDITKRVLDSSVTVSARELLSIV